MLELISRRRAKTGYDLNAPKYSVHFFSEGYAVFRYAASPACLAERRLEKFQGELASTLERRGFSTVRSPQQHRQKLFILFGHRAVFRGDFAGAFNSGLSRPNGMPTQTLATCSSRFFIQNLESAGLQGYCIFIKAASGSTHSCGEWLQAKCRRSWARPSRTQSSAA
jgi:hypothetical protein